VHHRSTTAAVGAILGVLLLAACQTGADDPATEPAPSPTVTGSNETPTPEPVETAGAVVNGPNSITTPEPGVTVAGPTVTVAGEGTAFEATLSYRVLRAGTEDVVTESFTTGGANGEIGPWTVDLTLDPGEYTVQVWEPDVSDGESPDGPQRNLVEVTFTVS
jgi:hypothetical protein